MFRFQPTLFHNGSMLSDQSNSGVKNENLVYQKIDETDSNTNLLVLQIIQALSSMVALRDPYTLEHQKQVALLSVAIAKEMELPESQISGIYLAAIVHDIGKFRIPIEILCKPGKIDDTEYNLIKTHPKHGYDILNGIDPLKPIARIVLQHHERLNGSGYPNGLLKDDILFESKILGVADVVEAMASHRPYRPSLGIDKAIAEIRQHRKTFYDSGVVDACIDVLRRKIFSFNG